MRDIRTQTAAQCAVGDIIRYLPWHPWTTVVETVTQRGAERLVEITAVAPLSNDEFMTVIHPATRVEVFRA